MDLNHGGQSSDEQRPLSAAELARKKVLAAYNSTVDTVKKLRRGQENGQRNAANQTLEIPSLNQNQYQNPQNVIHNQQTKPTEDLNFAETPTINDPWLKQSTDYSQPTQPIYTPTVQVEAPTYYDYNNSPENFQATPTQQTAIYYTEEQPHELESHAYRTDDAYAPTSNTNPSSLKDTAVSQTAINEEWQKYHSAWQDYYKKYYSDYYAKAAQTYLETEKMKTERIATGEVHRKHNLRRLIPIGIVSTIILGGLFLQYNRLIFAPIMAYISPDVGDVKTSIEAVDPTITQTISAEPRLIIPKLNIDVPVAFNIQTDAVMEAMNHGVAQFSIPGANALPGQVGNLVLSGHSAGDIYSSNPYKFIFSGLERLENGDLIYVNYNSVRYTYQMTGSRVVEPTDVAALIYSTDKPLLTLITCTPLGTSRYRLLVTAEQISPDYEVATPENPDEPNTDDPNDIPPSGEIMPANEPSFFESLWQGLFGN